MNQCIRLTQTLESFSNSRPVNEVKLTTVGIVSILGNLRMVSLEKIKYFNLHLIICLILTIRV